MTELPPHRAIKSINDQLDEELDDTFPASDPPSLTQPAGDARKRQREEEPPKQDD
ncbi:MAG: hypothetical protein JWP49_2417 [Phenylobacterium sp.]|jgi:hypothetical protein|nr:hypothetical protein [Phenylobacterium sp.]